ncbi:MAG TPA: bifunctional proline dehydrogenase/L-glutamate gamma-semialdehyde dehydrogenase PutA [Casimicrobiaceae bacterium]|jgi:RHH-type proline utilization regulon transcriptional repressor/proline dehydrogenase/delta 1-pyrroline-5-carboxylate dehydrogenase|nr:bifunctional proline dehydrogenase/L-glutamate gamma-semialdehyde dehydrogenase PutA [Casimicrobiaceae bacterium]
MPVPFAFAAPAALASPLRRRITAAYRTQEGATVQALLAEATLPPQALSATQRLAATLAEGVRAARSTSGGVDALMLEFSLDSREGVALMCLAEALLRIPDAATRDRLIRDKIGRGDWRAHLGRSPSLFVNAAAWGLLVTGQLVESRRDTALEAAVTSLLRKGGEPLIRKGVDLAMRLLGKQFVTGRTIAEAIANAREREARGYRYSYDMLGEAAVTADDAQRYVAAYEQAIDAIADASAGAGPYAGPGISIKLSALHPRYSRLQRERVLGELLPRVAGLVLRARRRDIGVSIDAEEADRLDLSLELFERLAADPALAGWDGLGFVVQAYQKRARAVIDWVIDVARRERRRLMVRLVKGAYWDSEIKRAQVDGLDDYPVFTRKVHTDVSYLACARAMLAAPEAIYPQFASHNAFTIAAIYTLAGSADFEFQCLHGMGESVYDQIVGADKLDRVCRVYAPVGSHETLLAYLVRRLLENGANTSFVNRIVDPRVAIADLVADPVAQARADGGTPHPRIPLPAALYGERKNSRGVDFSDESALAALEVELTAVPPPADAAPLLAQGLADAGRERLALTSPADRGELVGHVVEAVVADVENAVATAAAAGMTWARATVAARAACLERAADLFEQERAAFIALAVREAGKTIPDALSEVREAADFCRYYAAQARRELGGAAARGPFVAIAPWNFPLAIFVGQVVAALAAGNPVLAKPAEQTPLIAAAAVALLHRAGIPAAALQLLPGRGETIGAALVADARIAGVLFTGSTAVAQAINHVLARRHDEPVLIAETGGQNAMIVDSSALPEQVVTDAVVSAFDSAGQRCSALRVLCLQRDIAERVLTMLKGAMAELVIGDPCRLDTDVGPVIDADARAALDAHVVRMRAAGAAVFQLPLTAAAAKGTFFPPTLIEIHSVAQLSQEVFGPVLHVLRYDEDQLAAVIASINATGYGLTHGIQTRIDETVDAVCAQIRAGNIYVNRNMIGAVVGVQPFGGEGLSGTGPKAGGPHYLPRLVRDAGAPPAVLATAVALPGPTGESNTLTLCPRGSVACVADDEGSLRAQVRLALTSGNTALLTRSAVAERVAAAMGGRCQIVPDALEAAPDAVLFAGAAQRAQEIRQALAARDGPIVPMLHVDRDRPGEPMRLVWERTLTINTTASGGNASLLSLAESE